MRDATNSELRRALTLALAYLEPMEPPDSRAVSNEFVAMAAMACGGITDEVVAIIDAAMLPLVPKVSKDGKRRYGKWAGNPNGNTERWGDCIVEVGDYQSGLFHQCCRKRGFGLGLRYCRQHAAQIGKARFHYP